MKVKIQTQTLFHCKRIAILYLRFHKNYLYRDLVHRLNVSNSTIAYCIYHERTVIQRAKKFESKYHSRELLHMINLLNN